MVFSRGLVISLGVSALSATLLFLYFRNRMASVERKVDVMFDLIQSHENDRQQMVHRQMMSQQSAPIPQTNGAWREEQSHERNLIDVSDDEEEYDSEDSREVSDDDDDLEERIHLVTTDIDLVEAEEAKSVVVLEATTNEPVNVDETVELQEVTDDLEEEEEEESSSGDNNNTNQSASNADVDTNVDVDEDVDNDMDDSLEDDDSEEESDSEELAQEQVSQSVEYNKLKVAELKAIAEAKGLSNYKSLKKQPLIDLIKASE